MDDPETVPGLRVTARRAGGFRRAGRAWPAAPAEVPVADLSADDLVLIRGEPMLIVEEIDLPADPQPQPAGDGAPGPISGADGGAGVTEADPAASRANTAGAADPDKNSPPVSGTTAAAVIDKAAAGRGRPEGDPGAKAKAKASAKAKG